MLDGKRIFSCFNLDYGLSNRQKNTETCLVFETAMENIMPVPVLRARRVGGSACKLVEVRPERRTQPGLVGW